MMEELVSESQSEDIEKLSITVKINIEKTALINFFSMCINKVR